MLQPILATYPLELVHLDFLTLGGRDHSKNILLVLDHFTKYAQVYITKSHSISGYQNILGSLLGPLWMAKQNSDRSG